MSDKLQLKIKYVFKKIKIHNFIKYSLNNSDKHITVIMI